MPAPNTYLYHIVTHIEAELMEYLVNDEERPALFTQDQEDRIEASMFHVKHWIENMKRATRTLHHPEWSGYMPTVDRANRAMIDICALVDMSVKLRACQFTAAHQITEMLLDQTTLQLTR